jgi:glutathione S-transferase
MATPRMYSWHLSPFAGKARIALRVRGIDVDLIEIDPVDRPAELKRLNPTNRVPVLIAGDVAIRESTAIAEWAEETGSGPSLWPAGAEARCAARGMLRWVDDELMVPFFLSYRKQIFGLEKGDPEDAVQQLRDRLVRRWKRLDALLGATDGPWLMGTEEPVLTDLAALPLAYRMGDWQSGLEPDPDEYPRAAAWFAALLDRPEVEEVDRKGR